MNSGGRLAALSHLDGVLEVTMWAADGSVVESSSALPALTESASRLAATLSMVQSSVPGLNGPLTLTLEADRGMLHCAWTEKGLVIVHATSDANQGAIRLELRELVQLLGG